MQVLGVSAVHSYAKTTQAIFQKFCVKMNIDMELISMQLILCYVKSCGHRSRMGIATPDCSYSKSIRLENVLTAVAQKVLARFCS